MKISEVSLGTWQVGGPWGSTFDHDNADKLLHNAIDSGESISLIPLMSTEVGIVKRQWVES